MEESRIVDYLFLFHCAVVVVHSLFWHAVGQVPVCKRSSKEEEHYFYLPDVVYLEEKK